MSNVVTTHEGDRDSGVVATQLLFFVSACKSVKKHGHHMILRWCLTNLGPSTRWCPQIGMEMLSRGFY